MSTFVTVLLSYLLIYKYALLAGAVFASGVIPFPVSELILAAGAFASQGYLRISLLLVSATAANVLADILVYFIARTYGPPTLRFFNIERSGRLKRLEGYVREHAAITIVVTRFIGALDLAGTILAGLSRVKMVFFIAFDLLGNALNIGLLLCIGYFFGAYWQAISQVMGVAGWIMLVIVLGVVWLSYRHYRHTKKR